MEGITVNVTMPDGFMESVTEIVNRRVDEALEKSTTRLISVSDFAKKMDVGKTKAYELANRWIITEPAQLRFGGEIKFNERKLDEWLADPENVKKLSRF